MTARAYGFYLVTGILVASATASLAAPPWEKISFRKPRSTANEKANSLQLTDSNGPWMVFASSFAGDGAEQDAIELATELRQRYKLKAYVHSKAYDFSQPVDGITRTGSVLRGQMKYVQDAEFTEYAVLVGDFSSVDDPDLQKAMNAVKYAKPTCLTGINEDSTLRFAGLRALQQRITSDKDKKERGPMGRAFAVPNPALPREAYAPTGLDSFVVKMNENVKYSLLDCKGAYTVRVASFTGRVVSDPKKIASLERGNGSFESKLEEAADQAHRLTVALRKRNVEAYEFHDRHESIVTIGSFDWATRKLPDGKDEMNPQIVNVIQRFGAQVQNRQGLAGGKPERRKLDGVFFDAQPWPIEVPRPSVAADYANERRGLFR
ncbi:MAG: hypothetical protein KDA87_13795 [Planctomycetales bacterium]|nr:hypothetical protein [Planctomycetales bacterium]